MKRSKRDDARHQRQSEATQRIMTVNRTIYLSPDLVEAVIKYFRNLKPLWKEGTPSDKPASSPGSP